MWKVHIKSIYNYQTLGKEKIFSFSTFCFILIALKVWDIFLECNNIFSSCSIGNRITLKFNLLQWWKINGDGKIFSKGNLLFFLAFHRLTFYILITGLTLSKAQLTLRNSRFKIACSAIEIYLTAVKVFLNSVRR